MTASIPSDGGDIPARPRPSSIRFASITLATLAVLLGALEVGKQADIVRAERLGEAQAIRSRAIAEKEEELRRAEQALAKLSPLDNMAKYQLLQEEVGKLEQALAQLKASAWR